jgi:hypothetical protein
MIGVEKHMTDGGHGVSSSRPPIGRECIHSEEDVPTHQIAPTKPSLKP